MLKLVCQLKKFTMYDLKDFTKELANMRKYYSGNDEFDNIRDIDHLIEEVNVLLNQQPDSITEIVREKRNEFYGNLLEYKMDQIFEKHKMTLDEVKQLRAEQTKQRREQLKAERLKAKTEQPIKAKPGMSKGSQTSFEARRARVLGEKVTIT